MTINPSNLRIELYPTEALRAKAKPIDLNDEVRAIADRMINLMKGAQGLGLAAPQIGLTWRLFVAHVPPDPELDPEDADPEFPTSSELPQVFINPVISEFSGDLEPYDEGCLSLPGITGEVNRPSRVTMNATDIEGNEITLKASGLLARCWQHEIDHLDGVLILDKMTQMSRLKNRTRIKSMEKAAKR
jgi:peptide deformylase